MPLLGFQFRIALPCGGSSAPWVAVGAASELSSSAAPLSDTLPACPSHALPSVELVQSILNAARQAGGSSSGAHAAAQQAAAARPSRTARPPEVVELRRVLGGSAGNFGSQPGQQDGSAASRGALQASDPQEEVRKPVQRVPFDAPEIRGTAPPPATASGGGGSGPAAGALPGGGAESEGAGSPDCEDSMCEAAVSASWGSAAGSGGSGRRSPHQIPEVRLAAAWQIGYDVACLRCLA
jgi:hypothetical protein